MATAHKVDGTIIIAIPEDVAVRFHLDEGVEVEIDPTEEGIFLRPVGVAPWFSVEWERALNAVWEQYGELLAKLDTPPEEPPAAEGQA